MTIHLHIEVENPEYSTEPDRFNLMAAEGWVGLGDWREALKELDQMAPEYQMTPLVLVLRYQCLVMAERWEDAITVAHWMQELLPGSILGFYYVAQALHQWGKTLEAYETILGVIDDFPGEWLLRFAMARYCCSLYRNTEALCWIGEAIELADKKDVLRLARADDDLEPIQGEIERM